jgi:hypothetical protein
MKRFVSIAAVAAMVIVVASFGYVYACGEKNTSAEASNAKASYASSDKHCAYEKEAKAMSAEVKTGDTKVMEADMKASKTSSDCATACARAAKTTKTADKSAKYCPAPKDDVQNISKSVDTKPSTEDIEGKDVMSAPSTSSASK